MFPRTILELEQAVAKVGIRPPIIFRSHLNASGTALPKGKTATHCRSDHEPYLSDAFDIKRLTQGDVADLVFNPNGVYEAVHRHGADKFIEYDFGRLPVIYRKLKTR